MNNGHTFLESITLLLVMLRAPIFSVGVIGWAEGSWELILVQLFMCIVNHFLTVLPTIQIPLDL